MQTSRRKSPVPGLTYAKTFETFPSTSLLLIMEQATQVHLVRVTTDEGQVQIWLAATSRDEAVDRVLDEIPEGWAVSLIQRQLADEHISALNMAVGEVRRYLVS